MYTATKGKSLHDDGDDSDSTYNLSRSSVTSLNSLDCEGKKNLSTANFNQVIATAIISSIK